MEVIRKDGVAKAGRCKEFGEMDQFRLHPLLAVVKVFAGDWVISQQEASANCPIQDVHNSNLIGCEHFNTS